MSTGASTHSTLLWTAIVAGVVVWALRDLAVLVAYAVLLAYGLLPVVRAIERVRDPRGRNLPRGVVALRGYAGRNGLSAWIDPAIDSGRIDAAALIQNLAGALARLAARLFGGIGQMIGLVVLPLLAFYLLADADAVQMSVLRFIPAAAHPEIMRIRAAVDRALRSYVRGQAAVCLVTGAAVGIGLALLHHPAALLLGVVA
jgi:predicted PurR-regulated permease PerM